MHKNNYNQYDTICNTKISINFHSSVFPTLVNFHLRIYFPQEKVGRIKADRTGQNPKSQRDEETVRKVEKRRNEPNDVQLEDRKIALSQAFIVKLNVEIDIVRPSNFPHLCEVVKYRIAHDIECRATANHKRFPPPMVVLKIIK